MKFTTITTVLALCQVSSSAFKVSSSSSLLFSSRNINSGRSKFMNHHHQWMSATSSTTSVQTDEHVAAAASVEGQPELFLEQQVQEVQEKKKKTFKDDGFVFGLEGSGVTRPKGKEALLVLDEDSLETKPYQQVLVTATLLNHAVFTATAISQILSLNNNHILITAVQTFITVFTSWVLADLGSGILHWSVDNYGNGRTPIMGSIIAAFQGHHAAPWTITQRGFCNNVYKLCIPFGIPIILLASFLFKASAHTLLFFTVFCTMEIMSQELHKWSHCTPGQVTPFINLLQNLGLSINRKDHALHHTEPYEGNYCIISGICNPILDQTGFFRRLERLVYNINGVESNAWKLDVHLKNKTLKGDYTL